MCDLNEMSRIEQKIGLADEDEIGDVSIDDSPGGRLEKSLSILAGLEEVCGTFAPYFFLGKS